MKTLIIKIFKIFNDSLIHYSVLLIFWVLVGRLNPVPTARLSATTSAFTIVRIL